MTILLYIYLTGFLGTSAKFVYDCKDMVNPVQYESRSECNVDAVKAASIWPVSLPLTAFMDQVQH